MHAPDLEGNAAFLGELVIGKEHYAVYSSPADGSCFYHSCRDMLRPLYKQDTPSAPAIREMIKTFYRSCDNPLRSALEEQLGVRFEDRYDDLCQPNNWGQFDDALCLATMKGLTFMMITVESTRKLKVLHKEKVTGRRANGYRLSKPKGCERLLIYFERNSHYGVGVPITP